MEQGINTCISMADPEEEEAWGSLVRSPPAPTDPVWAAYRASPTLLSSVGATTPGARSSGPENVWLERCSARLWMDGQTDGDEWLDVYAHCEGGTMTGTRDAPCVCECVCGRGDSPPPAGPKYIQTSWLAAISGAVWEQWDNHRCNNQDLDLFQLLSRLFHSGNFWW